MIRNLLILLASLILLSGCITTEEKNTEGDAPKDMSGDSQAEALTEVEVVTLAEDLASPRREMIAKLGEKTEVAVNYGSPSTKERTIWGELVPYGEVWRTGANEATIFSVGNDVTIEGQPLPAGKYSLFTIPGESEWTLIFNETAEQWGAYEYDEAKDVLRVNVIPQPMEENSETMEFTAEGSQVILMWDNLMVPMTVEPA